MYVTKAKQAEATKAKLERVARELFAERGFTELSAEELCVLQMIASDHAIAA